MIDFLVTKNEWYQASGVRYSKENLACLFDPSHGESDYGVLQCMQVEGANDIHSSGNDSHPDQWIHVQDDIVMDNVAYTLGDHSPRSRESMKANALAHALDRKRFLNSDAGNAFISDNHPGFLSYLFPHLDPWGIGGFNHPGRSSTSKLSFEAQLMCLLRQHHSPFTNDPNFAFVCWNIIQKQTVSRQVMFSMKASDHRRIVRELLELAPSLTDIANKWIRDPHAKAATEKEKRTVGVLKKVQVATKNLKGSAAYKLCRRNEIRSLIRRFSTPALFVTLNPHDLSSILLGTLGGFGEQTWRTMTPFHRAVLVAKRPDCAARAFNIQIKSFLDIILRYGKDSGLFGTCKAYYGTVEAQGRGTLHCHLLIWLDGNPNPQLLRNRMVDDPMFRSDVFSWLEDIIKCELPGTEAPVENASLPVEEDQQDSRIERAPQVSELDDASFALEFRTFVRCLAIKCNWHVHNDTCYKHLRKGEPRTDSTCRMRINGATRACTTLDEETLSIQLRRLHPWINNYNDVLLFLFQSNVDIKYIGSGPAAKALVYYISDYITKNELKIHTGVHTLQAAMKSHAEKSKDDTVSCQAYRDRNMVTKCVNSLMGRQEVSHQQVMSFLIGGGDVYASHDFRPFRFYECLKALDLYERERNNRVSENEGDDEGEDEEWRDEITIDVSSGSPAVVSDMADYQYRPVEATFEKMSLWEFIENTRKVGVLSLFPGLSN